MSSMPNRKRSRNPKQLEALLEPEIHQTHQFRASFKIVHRILLRSNLKRQFIVCRFKLVWALIYVCGWMAGVGRLCGMEEKKRRPCFSRGTIHTEVTSRWEKRVPIPAPNKLRRNSAHLLSSCSSTT